ncbi:MAG: hypothetical protein HEEMFOPI_00250 [Holosporales bacterium]
MLTRYLDPKNDVAFRKIFGTEKNKDILIHFINDILVFKESLPIVDVTFLKTIQDPEVYAQKTSIVDVLCQDEKGNQYICEMQVAKEKGFEKRAQYYAAKAYTNQANVGDKYENLKEIIFIAIADFIVFESKQDYKSDHVILDKNSYAHDLKDFSFTFLELPKFKKTSDELETVTDKWMYFFKRCQETDPCDLLKVIGSDQILERAYHELDRHYWTEDELLTYNQAVKYRSTYDASMRQKYDEGKIEGKIEGLIEGEARGKQSAKIETAKKMMEKGFSHDEILNFTGVSLEELKNL